MTLESPSAPIKTNRLAVLSAGPGVMLCVGTCASLAGVLWVAASAIATDGDPDIPSGFGYLIAILLASLCLSAPATGDAALVKMGRSTDKQKGRWLAWLGFGLAALALILGLTALL